MTTEEPTRGGDAASRAFDLADVALAFRAGLSEPSPPDRFTIAVRLAADPVVVVVVGTHWHTPTDPRLRRCRVHRVAWLQHIEVGRSWPHAAHALAQLRNDVALRGRVDVVLDVTDTAAPVVDLIRQALRGALHRITVDDELHRDLVAGLGIVLASHRLAIPPELPGAGELLDELESGTGRLVVTLAAALARAERGGTGDAWVEGWRTLAGRQGGPDDDDFALIERRRPRPTVVVS